MISSTVLAKPGGDGAEGGEREGGGAEEGIRSLKIAPRHRGLGRKRLAVLHHRSTGRFFFSVLLSHSLFVFLSAVQSGGRRGIVPLGQHYKEFPKSGLAGCPPTHHRLFLHAFNALVVRPLQRPCGQRLHRNGLEPGTMTDASTQQQTRDQHVCIGGANRRCTHTSEYVYEYTQGSRKEDKGRYIQSWCVRGEVRSPSIRGCWQSADESGCCFCS